MYLSRIQLRLSQLKPGMLHKWGEATPYAAHQWLWQLFPQQTTRGFLFREEPQSRFYVLSQTPPLAGHELFLIETKPFNPHIENGAIMDFQLRANPVVSRNKKRCDVMMDAKFRAKAEGIAKAEWWGIQTDAANAWLQRQGNAHGFVLRRAEDEDFSGWAGDEPSSSSTFSGSDCVQAYQQHRFRRKMTEQPIAYSSVDYRGTLEVTDAAKFGQALFQGLGKSKALGCGLLMVKRARP